MLKSLALSLLLSSALAVPAFADPLVWDFGNANEPGDPTTANQSSTNGIFSSGGEVVFSNSSVPGVSIGVTAYGGPAQNCGGNVCLNSAYLTQKDTAFGGPNETGLGESDYANQLSDPDREVAPGRYLVVNNSSAIAAGYSGSVLGITSLDAGEGVYIFGLNSLGSQLNVSQLTSSNLLATLIGCGGQGCTGGLTQYATLNNYKYFVIATIGENVNGGWQDDFALMSDQLIGNDVPEPASVALLGMGVLGLALLRRRVA